MLVLTRRLNERIVFPTIRAAVEILAVRPGTVRLGIEAPPEVAVNRQEVQDRLADWQPAAASHANGPEPAGVPSLDQVVHGRLRVARVGVAAAHRQVQAGRTDDALRTLENLDEDFRLLQHRLQGEAKPAPAPPPEPAIRRALLVEDNRNERELLAGFLRHAGMHVDTAGDGCDALDFLQRRGRPDVLLLDMGLPRCDGASVVRALRRNPAYAELKIFAVSGHSPAEFDLGSGPAGVDGWFHKPIDPAALIEDLFAQLAGCPHRI
jgi:carbon storage regulator CsrA